MDRLQVDNRCIYWTFVLNMTSAGFVFGSTFTLFNNFFPHYMHSKFLNIPQSEYDDIQSKMNAFTAIGQLLITLSGPLLFHTFSRQLLFVTSSIVIILTSIGTVFCGLNMSYVMRLIQGMFAFFYQVFVNVHLKETLPVRDVGIAGSCFYISMSLGYIFSFYMKYDWTEKYYWLVLLIPAFIEVFRLAVFLCLFNFEGPKYVYFRLKKNGFRPVGQEEEEENPKNLLDSSKDLQSRSFFYSNPKLKYKKSKILKRCF